MLSVAVCKAKLRELEGERKRAEVEFTSRVVSIARARARLIGQIRDAEWQLLQEKEKLDLARETAVLNTPLT